MSGPPSLERAQRLLREDLARARTFLEANAGVTVDLASSLAALRDGPHAALAAIVTERSEHASTALAALESPQALEWLDGLSPHERVSAVTQLAELLVGTPAAAALAQELFHGVPGAPGPLATRLREGPPGPAVTRLATALAPHLDATRGDALTRLAEVALGRSLSTREYVAMQDLAMLRPDADLTSMVSFSSLLGALGEACAPGGGMQQGAELLEDFHRAWQVREPNEAAWWQPKGTPDASPVEWAAAAKGPATSVVWLISGNGRPR